MYTVKYVLNWNNVKEIKTG